MPISAETYKRVVLEDSDRVWELVDGRLREKPPMTTRHEDTAWLLTAVLNRQLDIDQFRVATNSARLRIANGNYFVPDVCVIPAPFVLARKRDPHDTFAVFDEPMPLVVEVWSPSTGAYDVETKLAGYQQRGDLEIWLLHPTAGTLRAWRRRQDGQYEESRFAGGGVRPAVLPWVSIELDSLFRV